MDGIQFAEPKEEDDEPSFPGVPSAREAKVIESISPAIAENQTMVSKALPIRKMTSFTETFHSKEKLEFLIENVLPRSGLVFFGGISGTGKTILAIQLVVNLVMNRPTMTWFPIEGLEQLRALMLSLEMSTPEWQRRVQDMYPVLTDEEEKILGENFLLYSEPEPIKLWDDSHVGELILMIRKANVNVILLDSASVSFAEDLTNIAQVNKSLENLYAIRVRLNVCFVIVAHTRKPPLGISTSPENFSINDVFGHSGIVQWASSIFLMIEDEEARKKAIRNGDGETSDKIVHIINVKTRFGSSNAAFKTKLPSLKATKEGKPLQFRRDAIELPPSNERRAELNKKAAESGFSDTLKDFDFGSILDEEDDL